MKLKFDDLVPQSATFKLSTLEKPIVLKPWSLKVRFWALGKYGHERLQTILQTQSLFELCEITYFMMADESKALFKDFDEYTEKVVSTADILALVTALLNTIGISEPMIDEIRKELHEREAPKPQAPAKPKNKKKT